MELGILSHATSAGPAGYDLRAEPLSYYGHDNAGALLAMMAEWGVGALVHPKVDSLLEGYRNLFDQFTECSGGAVTITGVELLDGVHGERIRMLVNGDEVDWHLEHQSDRYIDTLMIAEIMERLVPRDDTDPRSFVEISDDDEQVGYVFADPAVLATLMTELGIAPS